MKMKSVAVVCAAIGFAACGFAEEIDLSEATGDITLRNGDVATGKLKISDYGYALYRLSIADGATVTLDGVKITGASQSNEPGWPGITCEGNATIVLQGDSQVNGVHPDQPGIYVPAGKTLTIEGEGTLLARCYQYNYGSAAAIGAPFNGSCGNIVINGGNIVAESNGNAAAIGASDRSTDVNVTCGDITINGGYVIAKSNIREYPYGGYWSAAIGCGRFGTCGNITIGEGVLGVKATCGAAANLNPIGASRLATCGTVTIAEGLSDSTSQDGTTRTIMTGNLSRVQAHSSFADDAYASGTILTGELHAAYKVKIADGATVTLKDATIEGWDDENLPWAGITCEGTATLVLEGENVVRGFYYEYPGIYVPDMRMLTIKGDGTLTASSNEDDAGNHAGAGIGAGFGDGVENCGHIIIESGTIIATGGPAAAGIGGAREGQCASITVNGGSVRSIGGSGAAGLGGGSVGKCFSINISGGSVVAYAEVTDECDGAGIGSGDSGWCGPIHIDGGTVVANGGSYAAGIGSGDGGECDGVEICEGIIYVRAKRGKNAEPIGAGYEGTCGSVLVDDALKPYDDHGDPWRMITAGGYGQWAAQRRLAGDNAAWDAKPRNWGGKIANAFVYTYGDGITDGTVTLVDISFDDSGMPVVTTAQELGHVDFTPSVIGSTRLDDWSNPVELERDGDSWKLPQGKTANFFRLKLDLPDSD